MKYILLITIALVININSSAGRCQAHLHHAEYATLAAQGILKPIRKLYLYGSGDAERGRRNSRFCEEDYDMVSGSKEVGQLYNTAIYAYKRSLNHCSDNYWRKDARSSIKTLSKRLKLLKNMAKNVCKISKRFCGSSRYECESDDFNYMENVDTELNPKEYN